MAARAAPAALLVALGACADHDAAGERVMAIGAPIVAGTPSGPSQDAVVLIVYQENGFVLSTCTGTLVAPNLVLTARHCVADAVLELDCDASGTARTGGDVTGDHPVSGFSVFAGSDRTAFPSRPASALVKSIVDDGAANLCNHDIAFLVLDAPVADAKLAALRLEAPLLMEEKLTNVGWGATLDETLPVLRQQRVGIAVLAIGPEAAAPFVVPPNEFVTTEGACNGDSGGPALAESGAVVGVVARGTQGDPTATSEGARCVGGTTFHTRVAPFGPLVARAFAAAGATPIPEMTPTVPVAEAGTPCDGGACPDGTDCVAEGDATVCGSTPVEPPATSTTTTTSGCALTSRPTRRSPSALMVAVVLFVALLMRRREARPKS